MFLGGEPHFAPVLKDTGKAFLFVCLFFNFGPFPCLLMRASLSPYRPKKNKQLQVAKTEGGQWHTHFPERPTVPCITSNRGLRRQSVGRATSIHLIEWVSASKEGATVCLASSSAGGKGASNLHEIDGMVLRPSSWVKRLLVLVGAKIVYTGGGDLLWGAHTPPWSRSTKPRTIFLLRYRKAFCQ